jgi:alkylation response protein AidB-like acyl-CoA dehydrogenase
VLDLFDHYTLKDPARFWTSGQWTTEKPGGSDVGNAETIARPVPGDKLIMYRLHGIKVIAVPVVVGCCSRLLLLLLLL